MGYLLYFKLNAARLVLQAYELKFKIKNEKENK